MICQFSQSVDNFSCATACEPSLVLLVLNMPATFATALEVVHPAPESAGDTRFEYYWQFLHAHSRLRNRTLALTFCARPLRL